VSKSTHSVDIDLDTRVRSRVDARERHKGTGSSTSAARNADLRARDVKLGSADVASLMQGNVLDPEEVVARGQVLGDVGRDGAFVYGVLATQNATLDWNRARRTQTRPA
jgi:hypothetical protein